MTFDATWVKQHIANELGLVERDLSKLYRVQPPDLDAHLAGLGSTSNEVAQRVLSDVDDLRIARRQVRASEEHVEQLRALLNAYPFHPLVGVTMYDGRSGWRLSSDDAQFVAYRAADIIGLDFEHGDLVRQRLNTLVIWPAATHPLGSPAFKDRVMEVTIYLIELVGAL